MIFYFVSTVLSKIVVSFDWSNNTDAIDVEMNGSVFEEKSSFKVLGLTFFLSFYIIFIAKTASRKIGALIRSLKFLLGLLRVPINLPYGHAWNTVVMSGKVLLGAAWNC